MKKTLALVLAVMMLFSSCFPVGAITLETVETVAEVTVDTTEDAAAEEESKASLAATFTATPGLNVVNNKAEIENFDGVSDVSEINVDTITTGSDGVNPAYDVRLNPLAAEGNTTDKILFVNGKCEGADTSHDSYPQIRVSAKVEKGRKYYAKLKIFESVPTAKCLWLMNGGAIWQNSGISNYDTTVVKGEWFTFSNTVTAPADLTRFIYQVKVMCIKNDDGEYIDTFAPFYVDELAFVPYYKINYVGSDADYVLFADESDKDLSKLMTTYTVKTDNYPAWEGSTAKECIGWTLEEGSTTPVTELTLANADITLYPIWDEYDFSVSCETPSISGKTGTTAVVTAEDEVTWSVDVGNTGATYTVADDNKSVTVTAAGYAGEVKVKATLNSNNKISVTQNIALAGGDYVTPGVNVYTGTTAAYDFEGDNSNVAFNWAESTDASGKIVNAVVVRAGKDGNTENHAASTKGNGGYVYFDMDLPVIPMDRPVTLEYDYILGIGGNQVRALINYPEHISKSNLASFTIHYYGTAPTVETWKSASFSRSSKEYYWVNVDKDGYAGGQDLYSLKFINYSYAAQASYFDNIRLVPYYEITYDLNGGMGFADPEYFLQDAGTKYTFKETGDEIVKNGYAFKGWATSADATVDDVITSVTVELGKDITLYAVWEEDETVTNKYLVELYDGETLRSATFVDEGAAITVPSGEYTDEEFLLGWATEDGSFLAGAKFYPTDHMKLYASWGERATLPGVNAFENGDFETEGVIDVRPANGKVEIVDDNGNKVLKYTRNTASTSIQHFVNWEEGRQYKISYKVKTPVAGNSFYNTVFTDADGGKVHQQHMSSLAAEWKTGGPYTYTFSANTDSFTFAPADGDAISFYVSGIEAAEENVVYYDDLVFTPYYKVTYDANGGEGEVPAETQFIDGDYTVDTEAVLTREGYTFLGWSLSSTGVEVVETVTPTPGEDITLYATWHNDAWDDAVAYEFDSDKAGIANGTVTVTLDDATAAYTTAELYFADNSGVLTNYTTFGTITFADGTGSYTVTGDRAFPAEATRLAVKFMGEGLDDLYYWYTIPEEKRLVITGEKLYSFWALSDSHLGGSNYNSDYWPTMTVNRNNAFKDVFASDADFIFINGDVINYGTTPYVRVLDSYLTDRLNNSSYNTNNIPVFLTNGNHEYYNTNNKFYGFDYEAIESTFNGQLDYLESTLGDDIKITRGVENELWYAVDYKGAKLIFPSSPQVADDRVTGSYGSFSDEQLNFIDEQLYDGEKNGKVCYIISHYPLQKTFLDDPDTYAGGITNTDKVKEILAKHPNTIMFSGHTHSPLYTDETHYTIVGDMTTTATQINDGCLVWLSAWEDQGDLDSEGKPTAYNKGFSTGVYLEVYEDKIVVKSRKFLDESLYFGHGVYVIDTPEVNTELAEVSMTGSLEDGATFTALVDGEVPADDAAYTYEWYIGRELVSTEKSFVLDVKGEYANRTIALRVYDENGGFASATFGETFPYVRLSYTRNDDQEVNTPRGTFWIPGTTVQPDIGASTYPLKENYFFKGWATEENATTPIASLVIEEDTVLYPVYDQVPEFYFNTGLEGFKANVNTTTVSVKNGILNATSASGGQYFTLSGAKGSYDGVYRNGGIIDADTYKYLRIKSQYVSGVGRTVYFGTEVANSRSEARGFAISGGTLIGTVNGMDVKEYSLSEHEQWTGNILSIWYDAIQGAGGEVNVDYLVFADKMGIIDADVTVADGVVTVPEGANYTAGETATEGTVTTVTLVPAENYEFTVDLFETATINGYAVTDVTFNDDDSVVLTADTDFLAVDKTRTSGVEGNTITFTSDVASDWTVDKGFSKATYKVSEDGKTLTLSSAGYAGVVTVTATQKNSTISASKTVTFVGGTKFVPGVNIFTGTTAAFDFEGDNSDVAFRRAQGTDSAGVAYNVVATREKDGNADNKAAAVGPNLQYVYFDIDLPQIEMDRPINVAFEYLLGIGGAQVRTLVNYPGRISDGNHASFTVDYLGTQTSEKWRSNEAACRNTKDYWEFNQSAYYEGGYALESIVFAQASGSGQTSYFDNIVCTPLYKITYMDEAGENVLATDYVLGDTYAPDVTLVEGAMAFALTPGGNKVTSVDLNYEDIVLYKVNVADVPFTNGTDTVTVEVNGNKPYTFVTPEEIGLTATNFKVWNIDGTYYNVGDTVDGSIFAGKTVKALCFDKELFDETYGELVVYYDFKDGITPTYVNPDYVTASDALTKKFTHGAVNVSVRSTTLDDGRTVGEVYNTNSKAGFRYTAANVMSDVPGKYTSYTGIMLPEGVTAANFGTDQPWVRLYLTNGVGGDDRFTKTATAEINSETFVYSKNTRLGNGLNYFGVNWSTSIESTASYYLDGYAVYAFPLKQVFFRASADATDYVKHKDGVTVGVKTEPVTTVTTAEKSTTANNIIPDSSNNGKFNFTIKTSALNEESTEDATKYLVTTTTYSETYNYTFPTIAEAKSKLGIDVANHIGWTDGETIYKPGETVALSDVQYTFFYPYCQDVTKPAMGYAYEGDVAAVSFHNANPKYSENIVDDGRTVFHAMYWNINKGDARIKFSTLSEAYDVNEYSIFAYMMKQPKSWTTSDAGATYAEKTKIQARFYGHTNSTGSMSGDTLFVIENMDVSDNYEYLELDLKTDAYKNWLTNGKGFGFTADPFSGSNHGSDLYVDYIRIYRNGHATVNYNTNAPTGVAKEDIVTEVGADTNRGVGTGYLLTGKRPVVKGYKFLGWALTPDATEADVVELIDLTALETTVYAVWGVDTGDINASDEIAMRLDEGKESGIRFKATVTNDQRENVDEYGFIVARKSHLETYNTTNLTHNFKHRLSNTNLFAEGQAYGYSEKYGKNIDVIFNAVEATGEVTYAVVCTGINIDTTGVNEVMVARPYYRYTINGNDIYVYGEAAEASLGSVAAGIDKESTDYINNKEFLDEIIGLITTEESTEE